MKKEIEYYQSGDKTKNGISFYKCLWDYKKNMATYTEDNYSNQMTFHI